MNRVETKKYRQNASDLAKNDPAWLLRSFLNPNAHMLANKRTLAIQRSELRKVGAI
jgi:hypothetical protein